MKHLIMGSAERWIMIREDTVNISGARMKYRLFHVRSARERTYKISVTGMGESSTYRFGSDRRKAYGIYGRIVRGAVTPCTLADIAEDFAAESR
jgi:hypothetical protein